MKLFQLKIRNYKAFSEEVVIKLYASRYALIGRNNSGKSTILNAANLILGSKDPRYMTFNESDYFDTKEDIFIELIMVADDINEIWDLPTAKKYKAIFASKYNKERFSAQIVLTINQNLNNSISDKFTISFAGFPVH